MEYPVTTNNPRGSIWHKWDLHIHTPASLIHEYEGENQWERFISEIGALPPEFKVIGINDYIFLEGYRRILEERKKGRLKNISLVLPVIELRLDKFGGSQNHISRVNCHVIFSDELAPDIIEQQFLNALCSKYILSPQYDYLRKRGQWAALPTRDSLRDLGQLIIDTVPENERNRFGDPLIEGFNNLCISFDAIREILRSHYFQNKVITAVGKTEWADIKWNDHSIAEKKTIINEADFVFISAATPEDLNKAKQHLTNSGVNDRLLDCSDAHMFSDATSKDRLGKCFTWIKADATFAGLLQVLREYKDRVFLGDIPHSILHVQNNRTKYITSIKIERKPEATLTEQWFQNDIPLNSGLIAVIGNKGKGKSALTDIIGFLCSSKQTEHFTFLSNENFRRPKDNKSKYFRATLTWESGVLVTKGLDEADDITQPELAKYIPQNFLEKICTQLGRIEETDFDRELKKVVFSHIGDVERLGKKNLDELILYRTSEASDKIEMLKRKLHQINEQIAALEEQFQPEYKLRLENLCMQKEQEVEAHNQSKPAPVSKPENDPTKQQEIAEISQIIEEKKSQIATLETEIKNIVIESGRQTTFLSIVDKLLARIDNLTLQFKAFTEESQEEFKQIGLSTDDVLQFSISKQPLLAKQKECLKEKQQASEKKESLVQQKGKLESELDELKKKLDEPNKKYQAYVAALKTWEEQKNKIIGDESEIGTLSYYKKQLENLSLIPEQLNSLYEERIKKSLEIYNIIQELASTYRDLYSSVHQFIETSAFAKEKFQLNFEVKIVDSGFERMLFEFISHGVSGTFCGVDEGHKMLREILQSQDFSTEDGIKAFLSEMVESLQKDKRQEETPVKVVEQLRKGKTVLDLYNMVFSLDYLRPRYALRMGDKELQYLSPGERGTLLLVFYLLLDKDDIPLIIDQPEENLDNQTVYQVLVPCIKEAKKRRQIMMVTHNPNLAVVCDAEQVIVADLDKMKNFTMQYHSGAIENPFINKAIVDVLEGTMPAFNNRDSKYQK